MKIRILPKKKAAPKTPESAAKKPLKQPPVTNADADNLSQPPAPQSIVARSAEQLAERAYGRFVSKSSPYPAWNGLTDAQRAAFVDSARQVLETRQAAGSFQQAVLALL